MLYLIRRFLTRLSLVLFLFAAAGCDTEKEEIEDDYNNYKFDVIHLLGETVCV